jgi:hypothetical protein
MTNQVNEQRIPSHANLSYNVDLLLYKVLCRYTKFSTQVNEEWNPISSWNLNITCDVWDDIDKLSWWAISFRLKNLFCKNIAEKSIKTKSLTSMGPRPSGHNSWKLIEYFGPCFNGYSHLFTFLCRVN